MNGRRVTYIFAVIFFMAVPASLFAHGGDQRVAGGRYVINLSRSPFTPRVGTADNILISFLDITTNKRVYEPATLTYSVYGPNDALVYKSEELRSEGSTFDFSYAFKEPGLHEMRIEFAFKKDSKTVIEPEHFLIDVIEAEKPPVNPIPFWVIALFGGVALVLGWFAGHGRAKS